MAQTLAAWLNFASGAVAVDEGIDLDGDGLADFTLLEILVVVESSLADSGAPKADLVLAKDLSENLHDEGNPACGVIGAGIPPSK